MPNADLTLSGNAESGSGGCTKLVVNTLTANGAVNMRQSAAACASLRVQQWSVPRSVVLTR